MTRDDALRELASRIVKGDFVPFIGSGVSRDILHGYDWPTITSAMADELGIKPDRGGPAVAQLFQDRFGRLRLAAFLNDRLRIEHFDDALGDAHIALMEMRFPIYYSTNSDNVTETCYNKYGRRLCPIVNVDDLRNVAMGDPMLLKFHGDTAFPDSLVWTTSDYDKRRQQPEHFMHVRLRSDLLTHSLLFIGYSLSPHDEHVRQLLSEMQATNGPAMRDSVLIGYGDFSADLTPFGVRIISTADMYPDMTNSQALHQFLCDLGSEVTRASVDAEIRTIFTPPTPAPRPVLSVHQLETIESVCPDLSVLEAVAIFRANIDAVLIPRDSEPRVASLYGDICNRASTAGDLQRVEYATVNLQLEDKSLYFAIYSDMLAMRRIATTSVMPPPLNHLPDDAVIRAVLIALAADKLRKCGIARRGPFATWVANNSRFGRELFAGMDGSLRQYLTSTFQDIFETVPDQNPLLRDYTSHFPQMRYEEIRGTMLESLPRKPWRPS
jgi:hypothetical protein